MPTKSLHRQELLPRNHVSGSLLYFLFDAAWYLDHYPDAIRALDECDSLTALDHYMLVGSDGRIGTPLFDGEWYLNAYPEVLDSAAGEGVSTSSALRFYALRHYLDHGAEVGRNPNPIFDEHWYKAEYGNPGGHGGFVNNYHYFLMEGAAAGLNPSPLFDEIWYRQRYPDVAEAIKEGLLVSGFHNYLSRPPAVERDPCPYFKADWYRRQYPGHVSSSRLAYIDYLCSGAHGGYSPSLAFDEIWYRTTYTKIRSGVEEDLWQSGYHYFLYEGARLGHAPTPYFLPDWYVSWYPQVKEHLTNRTVKSASEHYIKLGARQGLSPNPWFNETWYLHNNPDVASALRRGDIESGHQHYLETGFRENRICSTVFDPAWYSAAYPDIEEFTQRKLSAGSYDHYCRFGNRALYSACADFDERWYRETYPDVAEQIRLGHCVDGLDHFLTVGLFEDRSPKDNAAEDKREQNEAVSALAQMELRQFLAGSERLAFPPVAEPAVSILLILYNRAELTLRCLRSILRWADVPYEIVVIDNASSDETLSLLSRTEGLSIVRNHRNLHFLRAGNRASEIARGKYLLFLNNDSEVQVGALSSAMRVFEEESNVGAVGGKIVLNSGVLQEAGCYFSEDGFALQYGRGKPPFQSDFMHRRDVPYCSGAFLMTPATLFAECGRFDSIFLPAYCEDSDYCLRLWARGLRVVFNPASIIFHHETGSSRYRRFLFPGVLRNVTVFKGRYQDYFAAVPDYSVGPISSLDGVQMRRAYLMVVPSVPDAARCDEVKQILATIYAKKGFVTLYPLQPWTGDRNEAFESVPPDVEIVAMGGQGSLREFCQSRGQVYKGGVILVDSARFQGALKVIRDCLPETQIFSDSPGWSGFESLHHIG
jgi:GT2 family glycosyltransferase